MCTRILLPVQHDILEQFGYEIFLYHYNKSQLYHTIVLKGSARITVNASSTRNQNLSGSIRSTVLSSVPILNCREPIRNNETPHYRHYYLIQDCQTVANYSFKRLVTSRDNTQVTHQLALNATCPVHCNTNTRQPKHIL